MRISDAFERSSPTLHVSSVPRVAGLRRGHDCRSRRIRVRQSPTGFPVYNATDGPSRNPTTPPPSPCRAQTRAAPQHQDARMTRLTLYPAIDLKDGACVRLRRGAMDQATVYSTDPAAQARAWQDAGFGWLHVVDLNGAFAGRPVNADAVAAILGAVTIPVQLGGGIRDMAGIEAWLAAGVRRVILGSAAVKNPALVRQACLAFPGRIVVGIDARNGNVAT